MNRKRYVVRLTDPKDIEPIRALCLAVYPSTPPWTPEQISSHLRVFPEGQFVVEDLSTGDIIGFAASLIVNWDNYDWNTPWRDFTDGGLFTNHDPGAGRTLYGAEVMVNPKLQGTGAGSKLYKAREELATRLGLLRIRAGARLRGYHRHEKKMSAEEYVLAVIRGQLRDATLSFQLKRGFHVLKVTPGYLRHDPDSLGYAAVIEWVNTLVAKESDFRPLLASPFYQQVII